MQEVLQDVTWEQAIAKPIPSGNSIADLVFHMNFYLNAVHHRLMQGNFGDYKHANSFNCPPLSNEADWQALLQKTWDDAETLAKAVEEMPEEKAWEEIPPSYGNFYRNLHGMVEHNHYHLGQIVILKKLLNP